MVPRGPTARVLVLSKDLDSVVALSSKLDVQAGESTMTNKTEIFERILHPN